MSGQIRWRFATAAALAATLAPAVFSATASAAHHASLSVGKACYVATKGGTPLTVTGSGFKSGEAVSLTDKTGQIDKMTRADSSGKISLTTRSPAPFLEHPGQKRDTITAEQFTDSGQYKATVSFDITVTAFEVGATHREPGLKAFTEKVPFSFSGFPVGKTVYGHYTFGGKLVASQSFGKPKGPCGLLTAHRRVLPATPRHHGYKVQFDSKKKYSTHTKPALRTQLKLMVF